MRIVTPNPDGLLKKDLFLDITVQDKGHRQALVVDRQGDEGQVQVAELFSSDGTVSAKSKRERPEILSYDQMPGIKEPSSGGTTAISFPSLAT